MAAQISILKHDKYLFLKLDCSDIDQDERLDEMAKKWCLTECYKVFDQFYNVEEEVENLKQHCRVKDEVLTEQLELVKTLVLRLYLVQQNVDSDIRTDSFRLEAAGCENGSLQDRVRSLQVSNSNLCEKLSSVESQNQSLNEKLSEAKLELERLEDQFNRFVKTKECLKLKNKTMEQVVQDKMKVIENLKNENKELMDRLEVSKCERCEQFETLLNEKRSFQEQLCSMDNENCQLKDDLKRLKYEAEELGKYKKNVVELQEKLRLNYLARKQEKQTNQEEITVLQDTINEIKDNLLKAKRVQVEKDEEHQREINRLKGVLYELKAKKSPDRMEGKVCNACKKHFRVSFETINSAISCEVGQMDQQTMTISNQDEAIRIQNETLSLVQKEMECLRRREKELLDERERSFKDVQETKKKLQYLENSLQDSQSRAENLQCAVDSYLNSVHVLEASEGRLKLEVEQQKMTIANLQRVLVQTKQQLDEYRQRSDDNEKGVIALEKEHCSLSQELKDLQEVNFKLEMDYCSALGDNEVFQAQLVKYQESLKRAEEDNVKLKHEIEQLKKLKEAQNTILSCYKEEGLVLTDQMHFFKQLLYRCNEYVQEENSKLYGNFVHLQELNERLSQQLQVAEQKALLENQMNQIHEAKICELQKIVNMNEKRMFRNDQFLTNIKNSLSCTRRENEELRKAMTSMSETIGSLQGLAESFEAEQKKVHGCTEQCRDHLCLCGEKLGEVRGLLEESQNELCRSKSHCEKLLKDLETCKRDSEEKEGLLRDLAERYSYLQKELEAKMDINYTKEREIGRYKKMMNDLHNYLLDLDKSVSKTCSETKPDCYDIESCKTLIEKIKHSVSDLKNKLSCFQSKCSELERKDREKEEEVSELLRTISKREQELNELKQSIKEKLQEATINEEKLKMQFQKELNDLMEQLRNKTLQLDETRQSAQEINNSRCLQLACAQDEVNLLKSELNRLLQQHCSMNSENEKLHFQSSRLQSTVSCLESQSLQLKEQLQQYLLELQALQSDKDCLIRKNRELLNELRSLQNCYGQANKQKRYSDSVKNLESELEELKANRDEICYESKTVIEYVRAWLGEQRRIVQEVAKKEKSYQDIIEKLKREKEDLMCQMASRTRPKKNSVTDGRNSPWSLGSQGTASIYEEGPSREQSPCDGYDWFAPNFRNDSDLEDCDEDWVTKVENLAAQVRKTNRMWRNKINSSEYLVSKDQKK